MENNKPLKNINQITNLLLENQSSLSVTISMPLITSITQIIESCKNILFPELYLHPNHKNNITQQLNDQINHIYTLLSDQLHNHLQFNHEPVFDKIKTEQITLHFIESLPHLQKQLYADAQATKNNDPAATSIQEILFCYPGIVALIHYRIAHLLCMLKVPIIPRIITEIAHSKTGIDIHPEAIIGDYFCIDHGTGVVIGQTCIIGHHVTLYQGVTLGARSFSFDENGIPQNTPRHPIIEDHVTIYSNASILGRITVGHHSIIGGNIWVTENLAPYSKIKQSNN